MAAGGNCDCAGRVLVSLSARESLCIIELSEASKQGTHVVRPQRIQPDSFSFVVRDDAFLPVIYSAGAEEDWTDPRVWKRANSSLGVSVKPDFLREECIRAKESPSKQNSFRRLYLNQWTEQDTRWIDMGVWAECGMGGRPGRARGADMLRRAGPADLD